MPSIETSIWLAAKSRVQELVFTPVLPIAWPNESFTKPTTGYLRVTWLPNVNNRLFIGSTDPHERLSILQIDVFSKKNQDIAIATEIAGDVAAHFPADLALKAHGVTCRVMKSPDVAPAIAEDTHLMIPVTIQLQAFH